MIFISEKYRPLRVIDISDLQGRVPNKPFEYVVDPAILLNKGCTERFDEEKGGIGSPSRQARHFPLGAGILIKRKGRPRYYVCNNDHSTNHTYSFNDEKLERFNTLLGASCRAFKLQ